MAARVPLEAPWEAPGAERLDSQTAATWIRRNVATRTGRDFLRVIIEAVFSAEPEDISMLHFLFYLHSGGDLDNLTRTTGGAQDSRFVGGSQQVALSVAAELGDVVRLEAPVTSIGARDGGLAAGGEWGELSARRAIVAVPPAVIPRIAFDPPLSGRRAHLHAKMPPGYVIKCMARYERPFWRDEGLSGQAASPSRPLAITFDNSPAGRFLRRHARLPRGCPRPPRRGLEHRTSAGRWSSATSPPTSASRRSTPLEYVEQDWAAVEWIRGGYGAHLGPGVWTGYGSLLREPEGLVHWAGSETSAVWNGYMDGAIRSGERAAAEVAAALA